MIIPKVVIGGATRGMMIQRLQVGERGLGVCSRRQYHVLSLLSCPQINNVGRSKTALLQQQFARRPNAKTSFRRRYYSDFDGYGDNNFNPPTFTPAEELIIDSTAWFIAFTLLAVASLDDEAVDGDEGDERRNHPRRRPTAHFDDCLDYQSIEELEDEADRRRERQRKQHSNNAMKPKTLPKEKQNTKQDHHH